MLWNDIDVNLFCSINSSNPHLHPVVVLKEGHMVLASMWTNDLVLLPYVLQLPNSVFYILSSNNHLPMNMTKADTFATFSHKLRLPHNLNDFRHTCVGRNQSKKNGVIIVLSPLWSNKTQLILPIPDFIIHVNLKIRTNNPLNNSSAF